MGGADVREGDWLVRTWLIFIKEIRNGCSGGGVGGPKGGYLEESGAD